MNKKLLVQFALSIMITLAMIVGMMPSSAFASSIPTSKISDHSLSGPTPPLLQDGPASNQDKEQSLKSQKEKFDRDVGLMEAHMGVNSANELYLDITNGKDIGMDEDSFNTLKAAMDHTNALLRLGEIKLSDVHFSTKGSKTLDNSTITISYCAGTNAYYLYWWGYRFYINECVTQQIEGALWMGAGATGVCAILSGVFGAVPIAIICGVSAGLATMGAGYIQYIDGGGGNQGIIVDYNWILNTITWIGHQ